MNNKVFYQHPNLMRALGMHETVMEVMVNVLSGDSKVCTGGGELMVIHLCKKLNFRMIQIFMVTKFAVSFFMMAHSTEFR